MLTAAAATALPTTFPRKPRAPLESYSLPLSYATSLGTQVLARLRHTLGTPVVDDVGSSIPLNP